MRKETSKIQITAKLLVAAAAIVHLIFTYVHTNALLLLEDQICGFIMFLFVLLGLVTLFEATQIHGERIREEVLTALLCMGTIALGMQLVGIYQQAIQIQSSLDVAVVQKAILFSAGLMTAFADGRCSQTLFWERKGMKKFLKNWFTDNRKAGLMRWWLAGMCYFMIGFGTQVGGYSSPIDFIFFLGVGIGLVTIVVYNPIAYNVFRLTRNGEILNHTYRNISGAKKAARNLVEIAASMITVILVYLTYQNLNLLLNQMLELPVETVLIPGEPFGFATLYLLFYTVLSELAAKLRDRKKKKEAKE